MIQLQPTLSTASIGQTKCINRLVLAPMSRASTSNDGTPTQTMADYYADFARGGFGMLIAEGAFTDDKHAQSYGNQPGMVTDAHQAGWQKIVTAAQHEDGKIMLQLIHAGAVSQFVEHPHAPSAVRPEGQMLQGYGPKQGAYEIPSVLTQRDIDQIKQGFLKAAIRAQATGFNGVEVHCANGYLLDQFLTEETNLRTDSYGGTLMNRMRLTCEIIQEIKQEVNHDFNVGVRLSQAKATNPDYFWPNGAEDAETIFRSVAAAGADFIHLASEKKGYAYHSSTKDGTNLTELARKLTGLPIIANGGLHQAELANDIIANEKADFVSVGKTALINPDLPKRFHSGTPLREFTFEAFKFGVTIEGQRKWEAETHNDKNVSAE